MTAQIKVCFKDIQEVLKYEFDFVDFANQMCQKIYKKDFIDCVDFYKIVNVKRNTVSNRFSIVPMVKDHCYNTKIDCEEDIRGLAVLFIREFEKKYTKITPPSVDMSKKYATYVPVTYVAQTKKAATTTKKSKQTKLPGCK